MPERSKSKIVEIPIFFIELSRDNPVYVDKHYLAKALENMVVVI